ncbi:hypothetical protein M942_20085 [Enterobacter ludwigii]|jgi:hypothetical protein|uniref:CHC2 zinc finger domain-containing protein n=1 Tax=Enterobacter ludwigii TaxID=299767 RepID=UPI0003D84302|nr:CHC2 zinc finger domain-containing protein [Enterobacter ludwigii]AHE73328.1 hypothetical protein M942_20085 [Enterobacter ludwigii]
MSDILKLIGQHVHMDPQGRNYVGLCPFHSEKTPSFTVDPSAQTFCCLGCGIQGEPENVAIYSGEQGGIVIYPWSERFALANHIEGLAYEMFPANKAAEMAAAIYRSMIDISSVTGIDMSVEGLKGMALLHDSFIETLKTEGIPAAPVAH